MSHLEAISSRQRTGRARDLLFLAGVVLAGAMALSSVSTALHAAQVAPPAATLAGTRPAPDLAQR